MENVDIEKIVAVISDTVSRGEVFRLNPTGISMLPTIVSGDDSVLLTRAEDLKKIRYSPIQAPHGKDSPAQDNRVFKRKMRHVRRQPE